MYGYGAPGSIVLGPDTGSGALPAVPLDLPKPLFRFGEQALHSTALLTAGVNPSNNVIRTFSTPIGQVGQGFVQPLSIAETNIKEGGRIPAGVAYDVFGLAYQPAFNSGAAESAVAVANLNGAVDTAADIQDLLNVTTNVVLSWDFTQTQVDICPAVLVGAGGGAYGAVSQNAAGANSGHMNNGNGSVWLYRKYPVALPGSSTFGILFRFGSRCATQTSQVALRVVMLGYYKNIIEIG